MNRYKTLYDIQAIVTDGIPEGVSLEYKSSNTLAERNVSVVCKTVSALANSIGGQFVVGIESREGKPYQLDGGVAGASKLDWIHKIINANTFPSVESIDVIELVQESGSYYVVDVTASAQAPHQSNDFRYYKRRGSHSEPMEHYEIEDVRNRPKRALAPLKIQLFAEGGIAHLHLRNDHPFEVISNVTCEVSSNFQLNRSSVKSLEERGLRRLQPESELFFTIESFYTMLATNRDAEITVRATYEFRERISQQSVTFNIGDFNNSAIIRPPTVKALEKLGEEIGRISGDLRKLRQDTEALTRISDGTGLRLSQRTLAVLRGSAQLFDPREFDWDGYRIVLGISDEEAILLSRLFQGFSTPEERREQYESLAPELRRKFEERFRADFE